MTVSTRPPTGVLFGGDANRKPNLRVITTPQLFPGCVVQCRSHRYLVEEVEPADEAGGDTIVRMACLDDDANGGLLVLRDHWKLLHPPIVPYTPLAQLHPPQRAQVDKPRAP